MTRHRTDLMLAADTERLLCDLLTSAVSRVSEFFVPHPMRGIPSAAEIPRWLTVCSQNFRLLVTFKGFLYPLLGNKRRTSRYKDRQDKELEKRSVNY
jgi:hypothetical protein